jgi:hypothetical protein
LRFVVKASHLHCLLHKKGQEIYDPTRRGEWLILACDPGDHRIFAGNSLLRVDRVGEPYDLAITLVDTVRLVC